MRNLLPELNTTMRGNKAQALNAFCVKQGLPFIRFDYSWHGDSGGDFADGCISYWLDDTLAIIDRVATNEVILAVQWAPGSLCWPLYSAQGVYRVCC